MDVSVNLLSPNPSSILNIQSQSSLLSSAADILRGASSNENNQPNTTRGDSSSTNQLRRLNPQDTSTNNILDGLSHRGTSSGYLVKNEILSDHHHERLLSVASAAQQNSPQQNTSVQSLSQQTSGSPIMQDELLLNDMGHLHHHQQLLGHHMHLQHHLFTDQLSEENMRLRYASAGSLSSASGDCMSTQKAVAFLAGPRERIHVLGNPVEHCPRCQHEGLGSTNWRPHRHIGELKIRYICERYFDDLESNHHFDIPLCPICNQVLYLYDFNNMLGVSNARRLHKYVLKCGNRHVLPLLDLFCQTKKGGERCNANFKLQWCYGTMVKRCEAQKNRDHDLWWVRYKNEWKQRRTIIRYKKDFLSHLTDAQRSLLLGLGLEGEPPPDPKSALGPTFDALVSSVGGSPNGPKIKKRVMDRTGTPGTNLSTLDCRLSGGIENYDITPNKQPYRPSNNGDFRGLVSSLAEYSAGRLQNSVRNNNTADTTGIESRRNTIEEAADPLRYVMGAVVIPSSATRTNNNQHDESLMIYLNQSGAGGNNSPLTTPSYNYRETQSNNSIHNISPHMIVTGTPTPPLSNTSGASPVAVSVIGEVVVSS